MLQLGVVGVLFQQLREELDRLIAWSCRPRRSGTGCGMACSTPRPRNGRRPPWCGQARPRCCSNIMVRRPVIGIQRQRLREILLGLQIFAARPDHHSEVVEHVRVLAAQLDCAFVGRDRRIDLLLLDQEVAEVDVDGGILGSGQRGAVRIAQRLIELAGFINCDRQQIERRRVFRNYVEDAAAERDRRRGPLASSWRPTASPCSIVISWEPSARSWPFSSSAITINLVSARLHFARSARRSPPP